MYAYMCDIYVYMGRVSFYYSKTFGHNSDFFVVYLLGFKLLPLT